MSKLLQLRGGTTAEHATFTGALREVTVDTTKDTLVIHDGATVGGFPLPRSDEDIRAAVEAATDSNVFTDADHSKLNAIEASATADQTDAEIRAAVEAATDSNVFTDADHTKLNGIEAAATADQTADEIRAAVEAATDSNVFTDADHTKLNGIEAAATADQTKADIDALNINADLLDGQHGAYYAPIDAPALTGNPTAVTQTAGDNSTRIATTAYADTAAANLVAAAPATLDTLNELAAALGDDPNFATTVTNSIATKLPLAGGAMTGPITTNSTFDGRDVSVDGTKLDGIASGATNVTNNNQIANGAGYITSSASISGNAATATALQTARTINGVSFNGSANITVADSTKLPLTGGTLSGGLTVTGTVAATAVTGDGSGLTGVGGSTTYGAVGTYSMTYDDNNNFVEGSTIAGANIYPMGFISGSSMAGVDLASSVYLTRGGTALSGTWRRMCRSNYGDTDFHGGICVRIS
jgi:hypothetical protein